MGKRPWTRRRIGRAVVATFLVIGVISGVWWWRHRAPEGFIVELCALEDGSAVVAWRHNTDDGASTEWIAHFDGGGKLDWKHELPGLTSSRAMLVIGDRVSVRYAHQGATDQAVATYALDDGHPLWDIVLTANALQYGTPFFQAFSAGGKLIEQVIERGDDLVHVLYALNPATGQILGHAPFDGRSEPFGQLVIGDRLVLHEIGESVHVVDTRNGLSVTELRTGGCAFRMRDRRGLRQRRRR